MKSTETGVAAARARAKRPVSSAKPSTSRAASVLNRSRLTYEKSTWLGLGLGLGLANPNQADVREEHRDAGVEERQADEQRERELGAFTLLEEGLGQAPEELDLLADRRQSLAELLLLGGDAQARRYSRRACGRRASQALHHDGWPRCEACCAGDEAGDEHKAARHRAARCGRRAATNQG